MTPRLHDTKGMQSTIKTYNRCLSNFLQADQSIVAAAMMVHDQRCSSCACRLQGQELLRHLLCCGCQARYQLDKSATGYMVQLTSVG